MKAILRTVFSIFLFFTFTQINGQCTQAQLNWDNLEYYYSSAGIQPYGSFISVAQQQTQKFAIGTTYATFNTPAVAGFIAGENGTHSAERTASGIQFTGEDVQFVP